MRKKVFCRVLGMLLLVLALQASYGQTKTISGVISDQNGTPLEKATIKVKGEKNVAVTNANGEFQLVVPATAKIIIVSFVGMTPMDVSIEGKTHITASLNVTDSRMSEVVVIGYGSAKRTDVSSAVSSLKAITGSMYKGKGR